MNQSLPPAAISEAVYALAIALLLLAPLAIAGVALMSAGLGRSRSAAQSMVGSLILFAIAVLIFSVVGVCWAGSPLHPGATLQIAGKSWDWIGLDPVLFRGISADPGASPGGSLRIALQLLGAALVALIPWGSGADRWRMSAACAASAIMAGWTFPLFTHWVVGSGWLAQLGVNFGLGNGFIDASNAASVHVLGGVTALCMVWITGPRKGKFPQRGVSTAIPGHNVVYVLFGCLLSLVGWLGWNSAGALILLGQPLTGVVHTALNTLLCASASALAAFFITQARFGKPDASLCANGWMGGLVASSASAALVSPGAAIFIGCVAGVVTPLLIELLELGLSIDDPSGAITVHGAIGIWGLIAVGLFGNFGSPAARGGQVLAQLIGISTLIGLMLPMTYLLFWLLNKVIVFRVDQEGERLGMDLHELGGGAYPEFMIHRDEFHR